MGRNGTVSAHVVADTAGQGKGVNKTGVISVHWLQRPSMQAPCLSVQGPRHKPGDSIPVNPMQIISKYTWSAL